MTRGIWGDPERYLETYWRRFPGVWTHGDWASVDEDGYWFLHGRSDDTLNIAGKRIGPAELESAAVGHPAVAEAAAIGVPHEVKGEVAWLYLRARAGRRGDGRGDLGRRRARARQGVRAGPRRLRLGAAEDAQREDRAPRGAGARARARIPATSRRSRTPSPWRRSRVPSDSLDGVALVTGGGRGIGASIARELADAGMRVAVTGRTPEQVEAVAGEIGGIALTGDVSNAGRRRELGGSDRAPARADRAARRQCRHRDSGRGAARELPIDEWWRVLRGQRSRRAPVAAAPSSHACSTRGRGRIVITGSGAAYLPGGLSGTAYGPSKAAVCRYGETLANELARPAFPSSSSAPASSART